MKKSLFVKGLAEGVPIGLGYFAVSIGIGVAAVGAGLNAITALLISMTNLTSAGQVAGISLIAAGGSLLEMALTQAVINLRYSLMGITLSQKLDKSFTTGQRLFLGAFITDEIFGVASTKLSVNVSYMYGLIIVPYIGWAAGTFIGASAGSVLPAAVVSALGLAIYGMFVAIVVPAMKKDKGVATAVVIAAAISTAIHFIPQLSFISYGFSVIISSVISSCLVAYFSADKKGASV